MVSTAITRIATTKLTNFVMNLSEGIRIVTEPVMPFENQTSNVSGCSRLDLLLVLLDGLLLSLDRRGRVVFQTPVLLPLPVPVSVTQIVKGTELTPLEVNLSSARLRTPSLDKVRLEIVPLARGRGIMPSAFHKGMDHKVVEDAGSMADRISPIAAEQMRT